jgi:hypothetical protein
MMNPDTVEQILQLLETYAGRALKTRDTLALILQHTIDTGRMHDLGGLAFHAAYVSRLIVSLKRLLTDADHREHLEKELSAGLEHFHEMLAAFISDLPPEKRAAIDETFLSVSEASLQRLCDLAGDLMQLKNLERDFTEFESTKGHDVADNKNG